MYRRSLLALKLNRSHGTRVRAAPPSHDGSTTTLARKSEYLYGIHSVMSALEVCAMHRGYHPGRSCSQDAMTLFVRDFRFSSPSSNAAAVEKDQKDDENAHHSSQQLLSSSGGSTSSSALSPPSTQSFLPVKELYPKLHRVVEIARRLDVRVTPVQRNELSKLCGERRNQNVVLEIGCYKPKQVVQLPPVRSGEVVLVLDKVLDPTNVGNILRSAYFFGVRRVILSRDCASCTPSVARTSTGALEWLSVSRISGSMSTAEFLSRGRRRHSATENGEAPQSSRPMIVGTTAQTHTSSGTLRGSQALHSWVDELCGRGDRASSVTAGGAPPPLVLLLGNEDVGLSQDLIAHCDATVHIPSMCDAQHHASGLSLNVNTACGVILSAMCRRLPIVSAV